MRLDVLHAVTGQKFCLVFARVDDDHPALVEPEVTLDERRRAAADRAEADHHDRAGDLSMNGVVLFRHVLLLRSRGITPLRRMADRGTGGSALTQFLRSST